MRAHVEAVIKLAKEYAKRNGLLERLTELACTNDASLHGGPPDRTALGLFLALKTQTPSLDTYARCAELIKKDTQVFAHVGNLVGTPDQLRRFDLQDIIEWMVWELLHEQATYTAGITRFDERYEEFEKALYTDEVECEILMILSGFDCESNEIALSKRLSIRSVRNADVRSARWPVALILDTDDPRFAIRAAYTVPKVIGNDGPTEEITERAQKARQQAEQEMEALVHALLLFKQGQFRVLVIANRTQYLPLGQILHRPSALLTHTRNRYSLITQECKEFVSFWCALRSPAIQDRKSTFEALRRFAFASERTRPEDQIIDLMIAAEALFLSDAGSPFDRGELTYRLALRAATWLGTDGGHSSKVMKRFRTAYRLRSAIVHGGTIKPEAGVSECVLHLEDHLRGALKKALTASAFPPDWESELFNRFGM